MRRTALAAVAPTLIAADTTVGRVVDSHPLNARFHRVVVHAPDIDRLALPSSGDAALGIYFAPNGAGTPVGRTYTVRQQDPVAETVTVDIVLHGDAAGTRWATAASKGDTVELAHARSWYRPPPEADVYLLAADLAGLPALARLIDETPRARTVAIVEVVDGSDLDYLPSGIDYIASVGTGNGVTESVLAQSVVGCVVSGHPYCWFAGEATQARTLRKFLRRQQNWSVDQLDVMGYWRRDADGWNQRFEPVGPQLFAVYQKAIADGLGEKIALERYEDELERLGL